MIVDIILENYRCFPRESPAKFQICKGFTAFVGANNSGKSTILRFFWEARKLFTYLKTPGQFINFVKNNAAETFNVSSKDQQSIFSFQNYGPLKLTFVFRSEYNEHLPVNVVIKIEIEVSREIGGWVNTLYLDDQVLSILDGSDGNDPIIRVGSTEHPQTIDISDILAFFESMANSYYIGPFRNALDQSSNGSYYDMHVGKQFIQMWANRKLGNNRKDEKKIEALTEDLKQIFEYDQLDIYPNTDKTTLKVKIDGETHILSEVGSGFTQFLLILGEVAFASTDVILIDEPELNLHPSLQLDFLTLLGKYSKSGIILFSTHNIGLARTSAQKIYSLQRTQEGYGRISEFTSTKNLAVFLGELSYSGYQALGFEKVLLVEGVSELATIRQWLQKMRKAHQVLLLSLGGSNLINGKDATSLELCELKRISTTISMKALIDSERSFPEESLSEDRQAFVELCKRVDIECHILDRRAIENYLTDTAIKSVKSEKYSALGPFQKLEDVSPCWGKAENWRIAERMQLEDLSGTDLGTFLERL